MVWTRLLLSPTTPHSVSSVTSCCRVVGTVAVPNEWSIVLTLHCSHSIVACPHVMQALTTLSVHMSCSPMMTLTSAALETYTCALRTYVTSCTDRPVKLFFILVPHSPKGAMGHVAASEPTTAGSARSEAT
jgi:hypothetical protein